MRYAETTLRPAGAPRRWRAPNSGLAGIGLAGIVLSGLVLFSAAPALADEVVLYDGRDFTGESVQLTASAPDLGEFGIDDAVMSIRVVTGTWSFHRETDFENGDGPPVVLAPGDYPDVEALGIPADSLSSVDLVERDIPPPIFCSGPYLQPMLDNSDCEFACAVGTVPDPASGECICAVGLSETGIDDRGRRMCGG